MRHLRPLGVLAVLLVMSVSVDADGVVQLDAEQDTDALGITLAQPSADDDDGASLSSEPDSAEEPDADAEPTEVEHEDPEDEEEKEKSVQTSGPDLEEEHETKGPEEPETSHDVQQVDGEEPADPVASEEYHEMKRTEAPAYAVVIRSEKDVSHGDCKRICDSDEKCEGFKFTAGPGECSLLAHRENVPQENAKRERERHAAVQEVTQKMQLRVMNAAKKASVSKDALEKEEEALRTIKTKKDMAKQQAVVAQGRDARVQSETQQATEVADEALKKKEVQEEKAEATYKDVKRKQKDFNAQVRGVEDQVAEAKTHMKENLNEEVDAKMTAPIKEKKEKTSQRLDQYLEEAKNGMSMEKKRYKHMKAKADALELKLKELPENPPRVPLNEASPIEEPKLTKEQQRETDEQSPFVKLAINVAAGKAATKEKDEKFTARTMNLPQGPSEAEMVKEATTKAERRAIAGLGNQKAAVKELNKVANKFLVKSSMSNAMKEQLTAIVANATQLLDATEDVDMLERISKDSERAMRTAVDDRDKAVLGKEKGQKKKKEIKEKQHQAELVEEARASWVENRLVAFDDKDKAEYKPKIENISKQIETSQPSKERIIWLNDEVHQLVKKTRKAKYDVAERDKLARQLRLVEDNPKEMLKFAKKEMDRRDDNRRKRKRESRPGEFKEQMKLAGLLTKEKDAKKDFTKQEKKLEAESVAVEGAELTHRELNKRVDKEEARVAALEAKVQKGNAHPIIVTELVDPEGQIVQPAPVDVPVPVPNAMNSTAANSTAANSTAANSTAANSTAANSTAANSTAANSTAANSTAANSTSQAQQPPAKPKTTLLVLDVAE